MTNFFSLLRLLAGCRAAPATRPGQALGRLAGLLLLALLPLPGRAGTPVLTFQATVAGAAGVDVTAFVDRVEIINANTGVVVGAVPNGSFETFASLASGNYGYNPSGASWTFDARSGIAANGSAFSPPPTTSGSYAAFLQTGASGAGTFRQTLPALPAGSYQVRAQLAQRNTTLANQGVAVLIDGREVGRAVPANDNAYHTFTSTPFLVDAVLRLESAGLNRQDPRSEDLTTFVDVVELLDATTGVPVPGAPVANASFEGFTAPLSNGTYGYRPTGATWNFLSSSGVARAGSPFGNPDPSPDGGYMAFLQWYVDPANQPHTGSCSQVLPGALSGSYRVRLRLAQRMINERTLGNQGVRVYLNDQLLGTIVAGSATFQAYTTTGIFTFQPLVVVSRSPAGNQRNAPANTNVAVTFSQPLQNTPATQRSVLVYSQQRGGLLRDGARATATVSGNTLTLDPTNNFKPGETVSVSATTAATTTSGTTLSSGKVHQFTTATGGIGRGRFAGGSDPAILHTPFGTVLGDVDGDGDLDLVVANNEINSISGVIYGGTVSVRLNGGDASGSNTGVFSNGREVDFGTLIPQSLALGDVDADGDLDLVVVTLDDKLCVRLNGGNSMGSNTGIFSGGSGDVDITRNTSANNRPTYRGRAKTGLALGDVDGDGDLDVAVMCDGFGAAMVFFNGGDATGNGTGTFSNETLPEVDPGATDIALGDVDGDGDLDLIVVWLNAAAQSGVNVRLNGGDATGSNTGVFGAGNNDAPADHASCLALGDVDGDGDLDMVVGVSDGTLRYLTLHLNGGDATGSNTGVFSNPVALNGNSPSGDVALGDVDGDGDLDVVATGSSGLTVLFNGGDATGSNTGVFSSGLISAARAGNSLALGDVDGDGDLDLATNNQIDNTATVRLNQGPPPTITSLSPDRGPVGTRVTLTGTALSEVQGVLVNGIPGTLVGTPTTTSLTFVVGLRSSTGPVSLVSTAGTVTTPSIFTVLATTITGISPTRNLRSAPANANVAITFADPLQTTAATHGAVRVFSQQRGGMLRDGGRATATVSGNTLTLDPANDFKPGETVFVTATPAATTTSGATPTRGQVQQFTVATGGTGRGVFSGGADPAVGNYPKGVAVGDVDGDGDLDLVAANYFYIGTVSVRLNGGNASGSNTGVFSNGSEVSVDSSPHGVVLGDVDGDGDLDLVTANDGGTVSVRLNGGNAAGGGTGVFGSGSTVTVGGLMRNVALGDVDGDGDLDLVTANDDAAKSLVFVRLNGGDASGSNTGVFSGGSEVYVGDPTGPGLFNSIAVNIVVLADVDNDGDLDIAAACGAGDALVRVRLNGGDASGSNTGVFSNGTNGRAKSGTTALDMAAGDMDGDGDLDLVVVTTDGVANVLQNYPPGQAGSVLGTFGGTGVLRVSVGSNPLSVALGDVNGDGLLDIVVANAGSNTVSVRLSEVTNFRNAPSIPDPAVGNTPSGVALADVDGDGDLDFVTANTGSSTVSVRFNQPPTIVSFTPASGPAGTSVTVTGTFLAEVTGVTVNGTAGTITGTPTATSLTFVVGPGSTTGPIAITSPVGTATSSTSFTVLPPTITSFTPASGPTGTSVTVTGTYLDGATGVSVNGTAGTITATTPTSVTFTVAAGSTTGPIRLIVTAGTATSSTNFTVLPPTIVSFTPTSGVLGTSVTVTGTYLDGATSVSVNGTAGTITANTPTSVTFTVGLGSTTGPIRLVVAVGTATSSTSFTVLPPAIASFTPASGLVGTTVTVTGTDLATATGVTVNGVAGTITGTPTATSVTFVVGPGSTTGRIRIATAIGTAVSTTDFTVERLTITGLAPTRNQRNVAPPANVAVTFSEPLQNTATALGAVRAFSQQRGGLLRDGARATATLSGNTLTLDPTTDFKPGETVFVTATAAATALSGSTMSSGKVHQFTVATGGTGQGVFAGGTDPTTGTGTSGPTAVVAADVDGDGDLDLLAANLNNGTVSVRLNGGNATGSNTGIFSNGSDPTVGTNPRSIAVGDVDGDGDLDFVTANQNTTGTVSVRLNGGDNTGSNTGTFGSGLEVSVGANPRSIALGDVDGDGDLDLVTANSIGTVSVRLNGGNNSGSGTGVFSNGTDKSVGALIALALGDVDGDGDLDLVVSNNTLNANSVLVRLNGGDATGSNTGTFSNGSDVSVAGTSRGVALGDVDGDGDLDLVATLLTTTASVRLNGGDASGSNTGVFSNGSDPTVDNNANSVALGDVDGDGDLDLVTANGLTSGTMTVLLNGGNGLGGGTGTFSNPNSSASSVAVGNTPRALALADMDGDGDLDLLAANALGSTVSVRLNQAPAYSLSSVSPAAELPGQVVTLLGTGFTSGSTVQFGSTTASVTSVSATSLTVAVPAGLAAGSAPISVSTGGVATPGLPFTVLAVYDGGTLSTCDPAVPATASVGDGAWHYLLASNGQVVAAYNYTGASLGNLAIDAMRADPSAAVRQDAGNRYYLGRNWHLTASAGRFDGRTVGLRLYGLNTEQARLQVADPTATLANLKATQYSGPNEDCQLANNSSAGESRVLPAPAASPVGTSYFVAQLAVADHFSEFYLTGSPTPLPVELTAFTATPAGPAAVRLAWATASEKNSQAFEVERSLDGRTFARVGTLAAAGNSATPRSYELLDGKLPPGTTLLYYRLRQVDQDGTFSYSPVRTVALTGAAAGLALFPNPIHGSAATLTGAQPGAVVTVLDALGRLVLTAPADATGRAVLALPTGLASGVYVVRTGSQALRLTVE